MGRAIFFVVRLILVVAVIWQVEVTPTFYGDIPFGVLKIINRLFYLKARRPPQEHAVPSTVGSIHAFAAILDNVSSGATRFGESVST